MKKVLSFVLTVCILLSIINNFPISISASSYYNKTPVVYSQLSDTTAFNYPGGSGSTYKSSGCGVYSIVNAVKYLTDKKIDPHTLGNFCISCGGRVDGGVTHGFCKQAADSSEFGGKYGFKATECYSFGSSSNKISYKYTEKGEQKTQTNSGYPSSSQWNTLYNKLVSHLSKGEVAVVLVLGHFMCIVDYDTSTGKFLMLDSAPNKSKRLSDNSGLYQWVTADQLNYNTNKSSPYIQLRSYITFLANTGTGSSADISDPDSHTYPTRDLMYTSPVKTGDDVMWVQAVLCKLGYSVTIDGSYGPSTKTAITNFQKDNGLSADGSCGPATRAKLLELWNNKKNNYTYSFTFNPNGGTLGSSGSFSVKYGNTFTISNTTCSRTGYTLTGWNVKRNNDNTWHVPGHSWCSESTISANGYTKNLYVNGRTLTFDDSWINGISGDASYTFYAVWELQTVNVSIRPSGGVWNGQSGMIDNQYTVGSKINLGNPTKTGSQFVCWTIDYSGGDHILEPWGRPLHSDPGFSSTMSDVGTYNNRQNGTVSISVTDRSGDCPTSSAHMLKITTNGEASPGLGGFYQWTPAKASGIFYHMIIAKIPVGYSINMAANSLGDGASQTWLTSQQGTGDFEVYIYKTTCGSTGKIDDFGFVYLQGKQATPDTPITWYVGYSEVFDGTGISSSGTTYTVGTGTGILRAIWKDNNYPSEASAYLVGNPTPIFGIGEPVSISLNCNPNYDSVDFYAFYTYGGQTVQCYHDTNIEHTLTFDKRGDYCCYYKIHYPGGDVDSKYVGWEVYPLEASAYLVDNSKTIFNLNEPVSISLKSIPKYNSVDFYVYYTPFGGQTVQYYHGTGVENTMTFDKQGDYSCFYKVHYPGGDVDSKWVGWEVMCSHTWNSGTVTKSATCTEDGTILYTCTVCNATKTEAIPAIEHNYIPVVTAATCTEDGYTIFTCSECGKSYESNYERRLGHSFDENNICTRCGKIKPTGGTFGDDSGNDFSWEYNIADKTLTVTGTGVLSGQIIPYDDWEYFYNQMEKIIISGPVTKICDCAFGYCESVKSVILSDTITTLDDYAFDNCHSLTSIVLPSSLETIGYSVFRYCGLESVIIPDSVTSIGNGAFSCCSNLTSMTIPDSTTSIGNNAFYGCTEIVSLTIPNSVKTIGDHAFVDCTNLTSVTIPESVESIGDGAFVYASKLQKINVANNNPIYSSEDGVLFDKDKTVLIQYPAGRIKTEYTIPNTVKTIGKSSFFSCIGLQTVTIPDSVINIESSAFSDCTGLTSVTIGNSVTSIGEQSFYGCTSLTSITIGASIMNIGERAFYKCHKLIEVINKSNLAISEHSNDNGYVAYYAEKVHSGNSEVFNINGYLFFTYSTHYSKIHYLLGYAGNETNLVLPDNYNGEEYEIYSYAFCDCANLTSVTIPDSVKTINQGTFEKCKNLSSVTIPNSVELIGWYAFRYCTELSSVKIPDSVTSICGGAFQDCKGLKSVSIPNSVTHIGTDAFYGCSSLVSVILPNNLSEIGDQVFYNCENITSITIPASVESIGTNAFFLCYKLVEVINKSSLTITEGDYSNGYVAYYALEVHSGDSKIVDKDGYLFYTFEGVNYLLGYKGNDTDLMLPDNYNGESYEIYQYAFYNCTSLTSVTIPNSVTSIDGFAFYNCTSLTSVTIPYSVTSIGGFAFFGCKSLTDVYYKGTEAQWNNVIIGQYNDPLNNAIIRYEYTLETPLIPGDLNGDGKVNASDMAILKKVIVGKAERVDAADVDGDGKVTASDAVLLKKIIVGKV